MSTTPETAAPLHLVMGLRCWRCGGTSTHEVDPRDLPDDDKVIACPHCFEESRAEEYTLGERYERTGYAVTRDDVDPTRSLEEVNRSLLALAPAEWADFKAVRLNGLTPAEQAERRGVTRGTVTKGVWRVERKLTGGDDE